MKKAMLRIALQGHGIFKWYEMGKYCYTDDVQKLAAQFYNQSKLTLLNPSRIIA